MLGYPLLERSSLVLAGPRQRSRGRVDSLRKMRTMSRPSQTVCSVDIPLSKFIETEEQNQGQSTLFIVNAECSLFSLNCSNHESSSIPVQSTIVAADVLTTAPHPPIPHPSTHRCPRDFRSLARCPERLSIDFSTGGAWPLIDSHHVHGPRKSPKRRRRRTGGE